MAEEKQESQSESLHNKGITRITVGGFKSIAQEKSIEVRPLTILAGANSSGKSSIMQPLLLLKQTLDATYDPGPLLLNGPNVRFTLVDQLLSRIGNKKSTTGFHVGIETSNGDYITTYFNRSKNKRLDVKQTVYGSPLGSYRLRQGMSSQDVETVFSNMLRTKFHTSDIKSARDRLEVTLTLSRNRCFLVFRAHSTGRFNLTEPTTIIDDVFFDDE